MAAHTISLPISVTAGVSAAVKITPAAPRKNISCVVGVQCGVQANLRYSRRLRLAAGIEARTGLTAPLKLGKRHRLSLSIGVKTGMQSRFCTLANGVTVRDAVKAILAMWGQSVSTQDTPEKGEAVGFLNAAMQQLHASGKDFGFVSRVRRSYEVEVDSSTPLESIALETDVQSVEGNVVLEKAAEVVLSVEIFPAVSTPLRPLGTAEALESTRQRYGGRNNEYSGAANGYANSTLKRPLAYFVRGDTEGVTRPQLNIALAPAASTTASGTFNFILKADVTLHAPRYSCCDVNSGIKLPVPHRYAESLLIPLARYRALSARYRVPDATRAQIAQEAAGALRLLGEVDPRDAEVQRNRGEAKA